MKLEGKKVLVLGLGLSGEAATELLLTQKAQVTVWDQDRRPELAGRAQRLRKMGASVRLGVKKTEGRKDYDLVVLSPGIPTDHPVVKAARTRGVSVIAEIELAYPFLPRPLVAVTGTNGKSTTVFLLARILKRGGVANVLGGNLAVPLSRLASVRRGRVLTIAEISSFQLENIRSFRPDLAVFLNFAPDHFDRYPDEESYLSAKLRLFENQGRGDRAILSPRLPERVPAAVPEEVEREVWGRAGARVYREREWLKVKKRGRERRLCRLSRITLPGFHNLNNVMAAVTVALLEETPLSAIRRALEEFKGLPHRMEYAQSRAGIGFYNDSKATNPQAVRAALDSFSRPVIWIGGGSDKGFNYSVLGPVVRRRVKFAIFLGETARRMRREAGSGVRSEVVKSLEEAVYLGWQRAEPGDTVLLSPGSASFDMFKNFEERGDIFKSLVNQLPMKGGKA